VLKAAVVNVRVKGRDDRAPHVGIREMSANDPLMKHRKAQGRHPKPGFAPVPGTAWKVPTYWPCGVRCKGGMTLNLGFGTELENRVGDAKGKGASLPYPDL
jgi:hypothetical protein